MNMCGALVLLGLIVVARAALIPDGAREPDCGAYMVPACTKHFEPVCGTDGATYANECMLCLHNSENKVNVLIKNTGEC